MGRLARFSLFAALACLGVIVLAAAWLFFSESGERLRQAAASRSTNEAIRYVQKRLQGHDRLEALASPVLQALQRRMEREPPAQPLPTLGKGQQAKALAQVVPGIGTTRHAANPQEIRQALLQAAPGTHILIAPGLYPFSETLRLGHDGAPGAPIVLGAREPGTVWLVFQQVEGILVDRPHWVFENLNIRGECARHHDCEHAFHVVGRATHTTLRNNHLSDFNAHVKVNGLNGDWPDHGTLAFNTLTSASTRQTDRPVTWLDLVGASHWRVHDNLVTNFAKGQGNQIAYGLFMKGAGEGGRIERNLVVCSPTDISRPGARVGISFGGGGTDPQVCRSAGCRAYEHRHGLGANNIVAHCNDAGLDVNRSSDIVLAHNTLINTAGFSIRGPESGAVLAGNLYEGNISVRDNALLHPEWNLQAHPSAIFEQPDALLFQWISPPKAIPSGRFVTNDFHAQERGKTTLPGALAAAAP